MTINTPDQVWIGRKEYSWRMDWAVNGWLLVAALISGAADIVFPQYVSAWPLALRGGIAVVPFIAIGLWIRSLTRWIGGMDELHRRVTSSAILFAVSATFGFIMLWHRLDAAGVFRSAFGSGRSGHASWDIATVGHAFLLLTLFYAIGYSRFNRRYR